MAAPTKAIIMGKDPNTNKYTIRIPLLETAASTDAFTAQATLCCDDGITNPYNIGDVVYIIFENNLYNSPVIIGKLSKSGLLDSDENKPSVAYKASELEVFGKTQLSKDTKIGDISYGDIATLIRKVDNINSKQAKEIISVDGLSGGTITSSTAVKGTISVKKNDDTASGIELTQNGYVISRWLQSTASTDLPNWKAIWVDDGSGWLYKRTKSNFVSDLTNALPPYTLKETIISSKQSELPIATVKSPDFVELNDGTLYRKKIVNTTITDLTNTTWLLNDVLTTTAPDGTSMAVTTTTYDKSYNLNFTYGSDTTVRTGIRFLRTTSTSQLLYAGNGAYRYHSNEWINTDYRLVCITGGSDATNSELIAWFQQNGLQVFEYEKVPSTTTVLYKHTINIIATNTTYNCNISFIDNNPNEYSDLSLITLPNSISVYARQPNRSGTWMANYCQVYSINTLDNSSYSMGLNGGSTASQITGTISSFTDTVEQY